MASDRDEERESQLLSTEIDPLAQAILDSVQPWDAYEVALEIPGRLLDALDWLPHGGALYGAWAELADLFETGKTPIPDAHDAVRQASTDWLARPEDDTGASVETWLERAQTLTHRPVDRDGDFWHGPK
ncbi:hypothetical protein AB0J72_55160 [Dactylosporangium sp. NPDC049742]|uniref:hypothetical protein n=1 Tax=Dactylosporangium sp. NPDC049742 TaxID=3154737 RepID=UPI00343F0AF2